MWDVVGSVSLTFMLNTCQININFRERDFFSYTAYNFSHNQNVAISLVMMEQMFSSRCIRMVNLVISSSEHHSPYVIKAGFSLSWMASTCLRMINTSCSISFHREKFFPSNFCIFTFVPDCVTIFRKVGFLLTWSSLSFGSLPLSVFLFFVVAAQQNLTLIPLEESI